MGHRHGHSSHAAGRAEDRRRLRIVLAVTVSVCAIEVVGALVSGSLALWADAGHMATDAAGIVLALSASLVAALPASPRRTFGYHRAEILAALVNAVVLLGICGYLAFFGVRRLIHPHHVHAAQMLAFAVVGVVANGASLAVLAARREASLNLKGAWLEVLSDTVGSALAIVAAVVVLAFGFDRADSIASLAIAVMILPRSFGLLRESVGVLLESAPRGLDVEDVRRHLAATDGVVDVHDLHAWTITSGIPAMSAHVSVSDRCLAERGVGPVIDGLSTCVRDHFGIDHATFQVEPAGHREHEHLGDAHD